MKDIYVVRANYGEYADHFLKGGNQLVDLLADNWEDIPQEFKEKLGLKVGLVLA